MGMIMSPRRRPAASAGESFVTLAITKAFKFWPLSYNESAKGAGSPEWFMQTRVGLQDQLPTGIIDCDFKPIQNGIT